jgi:hypothetical protein
VAYLRYLSTQAPLRSDWKETEKVFYKVAVIPTEFRTVNLQNPKQSYNPKNGTLPNCYNALGNILSNTTKLQINLNNTFHPTLRVSFC